MPATVTVLSILRRVLVGLGLWLVLAGLGTDPAVADLWYQHYQKAEKALQNERWEEAVAELNQAIERRGDSGVRVRTYGMRTTDYFPYLKLGVAYLGLDQLEAALQAVETEERLEAILQSADGKAQVDELRLQIGTGLAERSQNEQQRISQIMTDSLAAARRLRASGELDQAMLALGRGLAVAPENSEAVELMDQLRVETRQRDEARQIKQRSAQSITAGKVLFESGQYEEAASRFRQALEQTPDDPEAQRLLDESQLRLRQNLETSQQAQDRVEFVRTTLDEVAGLESRGDIEAALERLQRLLAIDPENSEARSLEGRLLAVRARVEHEESDQKQLAGELAMAEQHFSAGRYEEALSAANRALAIEPGNAEAVTLIGRAYQEINRILLGASPRGSIPPAIRFSDFRQQQEDGSRVQVVHEPIFRLNGIVLDNSPVELAFTDQEDHSIAAEISSQQLGDFYLTEFHFDTRLEAGEAQFRLVATDAEELSASSEYVVLYLRPWFRSPWFFASVSLSLIGVVGFSIARRAHRRASRRRRRFNPYVAGAPVIDESLFFGRHLLIDRILQTVHNNSLLLYGERRIGKTSIQHQLKKRLLELDDPTYEFFPVYVDLQGTPEKRFFATMIEDIYQELGPHLGELEPVNPIDEDTEYSYRDFVRDLRAVMKRLIEASTRRIKVVLLIDEVDELNDYDPRVNQRLRSLFMKSFAENLVAVVSGVEIKKQWEREGSPWYNFFEEIQIEPFQVEDARQLVQRPIEGVLRLEEGVVDQIVTLADRRPYLIQKICIALVNRAYEQGRSVITLADVETLGRLEGA